MNLRGSTAVLLLLASACTTTPPPTIDQTESGRLVRLTHVQWENTVVDLLGLRGPTELSPFFVSDPSISAFDNDAAALAVSPVLWRQYQSAAETLAEQIVTDRVAYARVVPQDRRPTATPGARERDDWITTFGERAFRRPLEPDEIDAFTKLFADGRALVGAGDPFTDGVRVCIAAFLQSPGFLYRSEGVYGVPPRLGPDELASKLSYSLWNTMPDAALREAAAGGLDGPAYDAAVTRMIDAPQTHVMVAEMHRQLLHVDSYAQIWRPSEQVLGIDVYKESVPASMQRELYAFVDDIVFNGGTVRDLFTSPRTFVDDNLAPIYDLSPPGSTTLVPAELDPSRRAGLLTLSGFLAWEASQSEPNLIERGAFVNDSLLCVDVPPPPASATPLPEDDGESTLRQRIEDHTATCGGGCHTDLINPIGFAFGKYDEGGRFVDIDHGLAIDATGTYRFTDGAYSYDGAVELGRVMAERSQVHRCYVAHLLGYLEGVSPAALDEDRVRRLTEASLADRPIRALMTDIVTDPTFREVRP